MPFSKQRTRARVLGFHSTRANLTGAQLDVSFCILFRAVYFIDIWQRDFQFDRTLNKFTSVLLFDYKFLWLTWIIERLFDDLHKSVLPHPTTRWGLPGTNPLLNSFVGKQMGWMKSEYFTVSVSFKMAKSWCFDGFFGLYKGWGIIFSME